MKLIWCTEDARGGALYGPYTRKEAFEIKQESEIEDDIHFKQVVYLVLDIGGKGLRLIRFGSRPKSQQEQKFKEIFPGYWATKKQVKDLKRMLKSIEQENLEIVKNIKAERGKK